MNERIKFMGIYIDNVDIDDVFSFIDEAIASASVSHVMTPNVDQLVLTETNPAFREIYRKADLVVTDGTPLLAVSRLYRTPIRRKIPGPELTEKVISYAASKGYGVFFLGAAPGVADKAKSAMEAKYSGLRTCGTYSPPIGFEHNNNEIKKINYMLRNSDADILFVGMGSPKQDFFVYENKDDYNIPVTFTVGAAIDFLAGNVKRAPHWVNRIGFEWLYRFLKEPKRLFRRYFINDTKFLGMIFKYWGDGGYSSKDAE